MKYIVILLSFGLLACSNTNSLSNTELNASYRHYIANQPLESHDKINSFKFRGWQALSNDFLILSSSPKRKYLVEINGFCNDLKFAQSLIVNRSTNTSLRTRFDSIATVDMPEMNCFIKAIYPINKAQAKEIAALDDKDSVSAADEHVIEEKS